MSEPTLNPFEVLAAMLVSVAVPLETEALPSVVAPIVNVTVPVIAPAVDELTDAVSLVAPPSITEPGVAETVTLVGSVATVNVPLPAEAAKVAFPL